MLIAMTSQDYLFEDMERAARETLKLKDKIDTVEICMNGEVAFVGDFPELGEVDEMAVCKMALSAIIMAIKKHQKKQL